MTDNEKFMLLLAAVKRTVENNCVSTTGLLILLPILLEVNSEIK